VVTCGKIMDPEIVTFEQLDREARADVARDAERLRKGEITPEELQEENSIFPMNAKYTVIDLLGHAARTDIKDE
jgi:hypothetical protein